jgi:hypothetical protein
MIHEKTEVPIDELKLEFSGQLLEDEHTLNDYNMPDGATVIMNYNTGNGDSSDNFLTLLHFKFKC